MIIPVKRHYEPFEWPYLHDESRYTPHLINEQHGFSWSLCLMLPRRLQRLSRNLSSSRSIDSRCSLFQNDTTFLVAMQHCDVPLCLSLHIYANLAAIIYIIFIYIYTDTSVFVLIPQDPNFEFQGPLTMPESSHHWPCLPVHDQWRSPAHDCWEKHWIYHVVIFHVATENHNF